LLAALGTDDRYDTTEEVARAFTGAVLLAEGLRDLRDAARELKTLRAALTKTG
jgi:hypothetical protein